MVTRVSETGHDRTFFLAHIVVSALLGLFVGGLYWKTNDTIAGFQSRVGSLFFLVRLSEPNIIVCPRISFLID